MSPYFLMMFSWLYTQEKKVPLWLFFCVKTFICIPYQKSCVMNKLSLHSKKYRAAFLAIFVELGTAVTSVNLFSDLAPLVFGLNWIYSKNGVVS